MQVQWARSTEQQVRVEEKFRTATEPCRKSKMPEICKWKFFERLEYKKRRKKEKSMRQGKRMRVGTRNYSFFLLGLKFVSERKYPVIWQNRFCIVI